MMFLKMIIPKGMKRTTLEMVPGEYEMVKILNRTCNNPFTKTSVPKATNMRLFLLKR
jgi:hypothetical protein